MLRALLRGLRKGFSVGISIFAGKGVPLRFLLTVQVLVILGTAVAMAIADKGETVALALLLIVLVATSSLIRSLPATEALSALFGMAFYGGLQIYRTIQGGNYFTEAFAGVFCFMVVAWVSRAVAQRLAVIEDEAQRDTMLVEELTSTDPVTGVIKRRHAHQFLVEEIQRSRRYNHSLSLLIVDIDDWQRIARERGPLAATDLLARVAEILSALVRVVDKVSIHGRSEFAIILPETPLAGARRVAEKIYQTLIEETKLTVRVGISEFPTDAVSSEELVTEAEAGLEFAKAAELRIADRSLIS